MPSATPVALPSKAVRSKCAACSAARCCGSIATASATETPKHRWSKRSAPRTKPPCRTRSATALDASGSGPSSHRSGGTSLTVSPPAAATRHAEPAESAPPGSTALAPTSTTCPLAAMEAGCGLLVGGDEARSEVRPASRASLGDAAAGGAAVGAATSRAAPPRRRRPAAAQAGCAAPPRPASRAPPPSAACRRPRPCRPPRRPPRAPHHDLLAHWSQDTAPRPGASPSAA
eukprot:scaffold52046_cov69-Phaeocystis_antarctica.AAC.1